MLNIQHCYELDRYNRPSIWLCSELCYSRQQLDLYQSHIVPVRANLCVVIQTHESALSGKGLLLSRRNWMAQSFNELSGCRLLSRWFPHKQYSNYCQRSSLQLKRGTSDLRLLPTDAVLNILMMDSNYCQRSSLQLKRGTSDLRLLPTDAVLNILMMDSYHATSKVVVLPQAGNVWKRIGVIRVADNLRQWFLICDHNHHQHLSTLKHYCDESSIGV